MCVGQRRVIGWLTVITKGGSRISFSEGRNCQSVCLRIWSCRWFFLGACFVGAFVGRGCTDYHSDFAVGTLALETLGANSLLEFRVSMDCHSSIAY